MVFTATSKREKNDTPIGSGSGFFINSTGLVITNNHVVDPMHLKSPAEKQQYHYQQGKLGWTVITDAGLEGEEKTWDAVVVYQNEWADQALLQVYEDDQFSEVLNWDSYLSLLPESALKKRMKVWALGFPGGDSQRSSRATDKHPTVSVTTGHVLELPRTPGGRIRMIYTDVVARPGNSGGPMVDQDGYLVGTVTLMAAPEGREDTGGANYSSLVPAKLTAEMVRNACILGKMTPEADLVPFMEAFTTDDGRTHVPEYKRLPERDVLFFKGGDRIYGRITTETVTWNSALGETEIALDAVAYVMTNESGSHIFLEGGNQISSTDIDSKFQFEPVGGQSAEQSFRDVDVVGFRMADRQLSPVIGQVTVLDTDVCHLVLADVQGTAKFNSRGFTIEIPIQDIVRFDKKVGGKHILNLADGRRLTGTFEESPVNAVIAATKTPIQFDLSKVTRASIGSVEFSRHGVAGLSLTGVLAAADNDIRRLAATLESGDHSNARAKLDPLLTRDHLKKLSETDKEQILLLDAVARLRAGEAADASKAFRKCLRSGDENLAAYAQACADVLKHYRDFKFKGRPLSDRGTFISAGETLAAQRIESVRDLLKDAQFLEGKNRGEYVKNIAAVRKKEEAMIAAALFAGVAADDELIRLWKFAANVAENEIRRLETEIEEQGGSSSSRRGSSSGSRRGGGSRGRQLSQNRKLDELNEQRDDAVETYRAYMIKLYEYGFRIEDPDIREYREKKAQESPDEKP